MHNQFKEECIIKQNRNISEKIKNSKGQRPLHFNRMHSCSSNNITLLHIFNNNNLIFRTTPCKTYAKVCQQDQDRHRMNVWLCLGIEGYVK